MNYQPPNDYTRVQRLLNSIKSSDLRVVSVVTTILLNNVKRGDVKQGTDCLLLAAPPRKFEHKDSHTVFAVTDNGSVDENKGYYKGFKKVEKGSTGVEFRYYTKNKLRTLSQ